MNLIRGLLRSLTVNEDSKIFCCVELVLKLELQSSLQKKEEKQISETHLQDHVAVARDAAPLSRVTVTFSASIFQHRHPR